MAKTARMTSSTGTHTIRPILPRTCCEMPGAEIGCAAPRLPHEGLSKTLTSGCPPPPAHRLSCSALAMPS
eukprot:3933654-Rhodomonas_salina.3